MVILFIVFFIISVLNVTIGLQWLLHIDLTEKENIPYDYVNFERFKKEFDKYEYKMEQRLFDSDVVVSDDRKVYIHNDIITFEDKAMLLDFISYIRFKLFIKKITSPKTLYKKKGLWEDTTVEYSQPDPRM